MIVIIPTVPGTTSPDVTLLHRKKQAALADGNRFTAGQLASGRQNGGDRIIWTKGDKAPEPAAAPQSKPIVSILDR